MDIYVKHWNEEGDYLMFPPFPTIGKPFIEVELSLNQGNNVPDAVFKFDEQELILLMEWAKRSIDLLKESPVETGQ